MKHSGRSWIKANLNLTPMERHVLNEVISGATTVQIAASLGISYRTVDTHRLRILRKTGARNTAELVRIAILGK